MESDILQDVPLQRIKFGIRLYLDAARRSILAGRRTGTLFAERDNWVPDLVSFIRKYHQPRFFRVINATGIIIHTNLGRSLLPAATADFLASSCRRYSNLELNLTTGKRGSRYEHVDELLCELTGAEAALVVNNNAAAVLIALETLAQNKEVVVSRGQLVEIGGSFRIPDIMSRSGARMVEVGTTNRTHLHDYEIALTSETALLLKVHCSNYRIIGFTSEVGSADLARLGQARGIAVMEDLGSGCLLDLSRFGLEKEPTVQETVASGIDVVTFSGDKLLGGPQAGIIIGKKRYIDQIKKNPLNRALRIDKLTLASLESVLRLYLVESSALREIPTLAMITAPEAVIRQRATSFLQKCRERIGEHCAFEMMRSLSQVGGGAMPGQNLESWAIAVQPAGMRPSQLEKKLRQATLPVISRMESDRLLLDMRTVADDELDLLVASLANALVVSPEREHENSTGTRQ
jgi:L-seryl-tRNA(Ser) seleniumtransferase